MSRAVYLDGVFVIDRINATEITQESPEYEFPIIDAAECKDKHGKWFKQRLIFEPVKANNIDSQDGNEEFHGIIELKVWRCTKIATQSKLPDKPHKTRVNHIPESCIKHNNITYVACLGPKERFPAQRNLNSLERKITDRTYRVQYLDDEDEPYAAFKFQYRSNGKLGSYLALYSAKIYIYIQERRSLALMTKSGARHLIQHRELEEKNSITLLQIT